MYNEQGYIKVLHNKEKVAESMQAVYRFADEMA